ncbi:MAG: tRNA lysidine(34) synthetase TilS [Bacteroidota bacterium]|nr:tRNA lysidine(34) synthetase TilS [Bacteroidota bacterium]
MKSKDLNSKFLKFVEQNGLIKKDCKVLAAVSGGADSVAMCNLFFTNNINFEIAHVNFKLRGEDSEKDEAFVKELALKYNTVCHVISYDTRKYASQNKLSIEMAARKLRYDWFEKLCKEMNFDKVAIAHHQNDNVETVLLNLARGSGIKGMRGILSKSEKIIRPLLFLKRKDIEKYLEEDKLAFRIDKTNFDTEIKRNFVRYKVIPELKELNPNVEETISKSVEIFKEYENFINRQIEIIKSKILKVEKDIIKISIDKLIKYEDKKLILFEILNDYGFNNSDVLDIINSLNEESGKSFYSVNYVLVKDREYLLLSKKQSQQEEEKSFDINTIELEFEDSIFKISKIRNDEIDDLKNPSIAYLNSEKIKFPLKVGHWQQGDYFYPFGMKTKKKLSDFFIDEKFSLLEKNKILVVKSANEIVWVVGKRIDDRFRIDKNSNEIIKIIVR